MNEKATIFSASSFMGNIVKHEVTLVEHGRCKYAQYNSAPFVVFKPKRARKARKMLVAHKPYILVVKGWGHPEPDEMYKPMAPAAPGEGCSMLEGRHAAFDDAWKDDFDQKINPMIDGGEIEVLADYRGVNTYEQVPQG